MTTDATLLRGMIANLVPNAIRYPPGGEVAVRAVEPAGGGLRLAVEDTGIGPPHDRLHTIFQDFVRLENERRYAKDGFGLGLGIVRRLSTLLSVGVTVESEPGRGSRVAVHVPATKVCHAA